MPERALSARLSRGLYPERRVPRESWLDRAAVSVLGNALRPFRGRAARFRAIVPRTKAWAKALGERPEGWMAEEVASLRAVLARRPVGLDEAARVFAVVRETARRRLDTPHYDVQLMGGWILLNGMMAEMETGEGKTLTAVLPACASALAGVPVHVITVNDYLARRDAEAMAPIYRALGLTVGVITSGMGLRERQEAYRCDVTYCTNKEVAFDYLKDRLVLGQRPGPIQLRLERLGSADARLDRLCMRGLFFAIVDEADSVLVDEARTPLIISGGGQEGCEAEVYRQALELAERLVQGRDYRLDGDKRSVELTEAGESTLEELAEPLGGFWAGRLRRQELIREALSSIHLFQRDRDYLLRDGKVHIIDEYTGRTMEGRSWERGLHQLIETKECCEVTTRNETLARISYQRFFRRYLRLAGMTGTAKEVAGELWSVYRVCTVRVPTNKPLIRRALSPRVLGGATAKWNGIVSEITDLYRLGRPVLVGTRSVGSSEYLSGRLAEEGIPHRLLNARQDKEEAEIVAEAGQVGQVTVATNMAGRGTDIPISSAVKRLGGLHVIATERHEARRIDRQLFGRGGRQGDPGTYRLFASLEDEVLSPGARTAFGRLVRLLARRHDPLSRSLCHAFATRAQVRAEKKHRRIRRELLKLDDNLENVLSFSGTGE